MILIKAQRDALLRPLQMVTGIVERRHTLPILSNVLIRKTGATVAFVATDIEMQITTFGEIGHGPDDFAITVSAKKLLDILRALHADHEVTISFANQKLSIAQGKSKFSLQTLGADEFPTVTPAPQYTAQTVLSQQDFKRCLHLVQFAMAQQDIRYYLNGMLLVLSPDALKTVATDGHRLSYQAVKIDQAGSIEVIIPRKVITELQKILNDTSDSVEISLTSNQVLFKFGQIEILSKLIEGKFPDYDRVIPKGHTKHIPLLRETFLQSLSRVAILTTDKFKGVRLSLQDHTLRLTATNAEQEEAVEELDVEYEGELLEIGFNVQYLLDVLSVLKEEKVTLSLQDTNASALITTPTDESFRYVVMPMRI
jgi:DNA polymerase III subunit beta